MADTVLRVIADDGSFRVVAALTTDTVKAVAEAQRVQGVTASLLGELLTGTILIRETMAPQLRVQGILKSGSAKGGSLVADSHPDGTARGLVSGLTFGETNRMQGAVLQMMRTLHNGALHQGIVEFRGGNISSALMEYLLNSEQVASTVAVAALLDHDRIAVAGGYLVQLLPEAKPDALAAMTNRIARLTSIESLLSVGKASPSELADALLAGIPFTRLEEKPLRFGCRCSKERLLATLATLDAREIQEIVAEGKPVDITCDYCNLAYVLTVEELRSLLNGASLGAGTALVFGNTFDTLLIPLNVSAVAVLFADALLN
ncbi:MAG: Hsp33 family molecular chaperone HslO, partial [Myxococcales bacterium]|nr:Hsp33 family molecular chaperone HslO [Myxococcales bacterium]